VCDCISEEMQAKNRKDIIQEDIQPGSKIINIVIWLFLSTCLLNLYLVWNIWLSIMAVIFIFINVHYLCFFSRYESMDWSIW